MLDIISNILDLLVGFFSAVGGLLSDIAMLIVKVGKAVTYVPMLLSWLPDAVVPILIGTFGVVVVYKVLGREG